MTRRKVAVTVPEQLMKIVEKEVAEGKAASISAFVTDALEEYTDGGSLGELLDEMDREFGKPTKETTAWARRVLGL